VDCCWLLKSNYNEIRRNSEVGREKIFSFWTVVFVPPSWRQLCRINSDRPFGAIEEHMHAEIRTRRQTDIRYSSNHFYVIRGLKTWKSIEMWRLILFRVKEIDHMRSQCMGKPAPENTCIHT
jgi:hypothetical protein